MHGVTRDAAMKDAAVREAFDAAQQLLRDGSVAFIEIPNAVKLHLRSTPQWSLILGSGTRSARIRRDCDSGQIRKTEK
jgi:hypothetical protein